MKKVEELKLIKDKYPILGWPIIRGTVNFIESMVTGVKAINYSSEQLLNGEEAEKDKLDLWLEKHVPAEKLQSVLIAVSVILAVGMSVGLFMVLPADREMTIEPALVKDGKILMVGNERANYLYSVGGRIKFGETAEEAIVREVFEETGVKMEIDRLGFVHENYFYGDSSSKLGKLIYEISFYFYMKVPSDFTPISDSFTEDNSKEYLRWVSLNEDIKMYPEFFRTELKNPKDTVKHFIKDER